MNRFIRIVACLSVIFCSTWVSASDFDGSKPLVCAMVEVLDCGLLDECARVNPESVNLPDIFHVDLKKKELKGKDRTTKVRHIFHEQGNVVLQGISENGRAWSILLSGDTGKYTGAIAGVEFGFLIF